MCIRMAYASNHFILFFNRMHWMRPRNRTGDIPSLSPVDSRVRRLSTCQASLGPGANPKLPRSRSGVSASIPTEVSHEVTELPLPFSLMDPSTSPERPRKRRAINACLNCRTSKVRCDGRQPCQRCDRNNAVCQYRETARDESTLRLEQLEAEVASLRHEIGSMNRNTVATDGLQLTSSARPVDGPSNLGKRKATTNAVESGLITWEMANSWFQRHDDAQGAKPNAP